MRYYQLVILVMLTCSLLIALDRCTIRYTRLKKKDEIRIGTCVLFYIFIILPGNKTDCKTADRVIRKEDGEKLAQEYNVAFMETSAKTGLNVDLAFTAIARYE